MKSVERMMKSGREIPMDQNIPALGTKEREGDLRNKDGGLRGFHGVRTTRKFNFSRRHSR